MFCAQCGNAVAEGTATCPRCGAPVGGNAPAGQYPASSQYQGGPPPQGGQYPPGGQYQQGGAGYPPPGGGPGYPPSPRQGASVQGFNFNAARLSQADRIAGAASVVLLISLFLPWFSVSLGSLGSASASGTTAHGYLWLVFFLCLAIVAFLIFGAGFEQMPVQLPLAREMILLVATGINLLIVLLAFFVRPPGLGIVTVGWDFGAFIALIAAIVACVPLAVPFLRSRTGN